MICTRFFKIGKSIAPLIRSQGEYKIGNAKNIGQSTSHGTNFVSLPAVGREHSVKRIKRAQSPFLSFSLFYLFIALVLNSGQMAIKLLTRIRPPPIKCCAPRDSPSRITPNIDP